jgi:hypothetical protein
MVCFRSFPQDISGGMVISLLSEWPSAQLLSIWLPPPPPFTQGAITDMLEEDVVQPLLVTSSALTLATECVRMILKIDDIVPVR